MLTATDPLEQGTGVASRRRRSLRAPDARPATAPRRGGRVWRRRARGLIGVAGAFLIWFAVSQPALVSHQELPTIGAVARALSDSRGDLLSGLGTTVESLFIGVAIGAVLGATLGIAVGLSRWADAATDVLVRMMRPLPSLALIPIAILVAGLGVEMTSGLVAFSAFWPIFINARYAARQVEPRLLDAGRSLGLGRAGLIARVVLPSVAPAVATGVRIAVGIATVVTISVEMVAGTGGLGGFVLLAEQSGSIPLLYAGIVVGGLLGWLLNLAFGLVTRWALPWDVSARERDR